jgi:hypothetical protein
MDVVNGNPVVIIELNKHTLMLYLNHYGTVKTETRQFLTACPS